MSWDEWFEKRKRRPFFDWGIFGLPFFSKDVDEMFKEMERRMEEIFKELGEAIPQDFIRERKLPDGSVERIFGPFVYGYSMTVGPDGKPQIREFGNIKPIARATRTGGIRPSLDIKDAREPLVDVMPTNGEIKVIAELPGVNKQDINLSGLEDKLIISVDTPGRKYYKEVDLPVKVDVKSAKSTYINGVLEVTLPKVEEKKPKGVSIKVE
ncbi:MAG: archaeal heat shock protein Hsp20 [Candidatus Bathyarchaeia archaeon]